MTLTVQPVRVSSEEGDGLLVMSSGSLVAILVRLSELHEEDAGKWYLEAGIGRLHEAGAHPVLDTLEDALDFVEAKLRA